MNTPTMKWAEVSPGHWQSDSGLHCVHVYAKDPCQDCKGTGRRGRGRCRSCFDGKRYRSYKIEPVGGECILTTVSSTPRSLRAAQEIAEIIGDPNQVWGFDPDCDAPLDETDRHLAMVMAGKPR
jgi:hypothetical protein